MNPLYALDSPPTAKVAVVVQVERVDRSFDNQGHRRRLDVFVAQVDVVTVDLAGGRGTGPPAVSHDTQRSAPAPPIDTRSMRGRFTTPRTRSTRT